MASPSTQHGGTEEAAAAAPPGNDRSVDVPLDCLCPIAVAIVRELKIGEDDDGGVVGSQWWGDERYGGMKKYIEIDM
uniref:Uncharacterized protein n=1 Tax=Oryza sativa subsp. japonica TaxID=39947 RepID=Q5Z5A2_ORYSJ|nr:hypothetical protein [Oryza sativa Japonica Group]